MGESFYSVLGVGVDADADAIERAYRERVKQHHPDVSDTPDARRTFKRLTIARDTLVDGDERFRYDTIGHERYLREHTPPGVFDVDGSSGGSTESQPPQDADYSASASRTIGESRSSEPSPESEWSSQSAAASQVATDGGSAPRESTATTLTGGRSHSTPAGTSSIYDAGSTARTSRSRESTVSDLIDSAGSLAPWLAFYLLAGAAVVAIGLPVFGGGIYGGSAGTAVFTTVIVVVTMVASALHFVSQLA